MKKILITAMVCALVLAFLPISDVFAVDTTKLADKEFKFTGIAKRYDGAAVMRIRPNYSGNTHLWKPRGCSSCISVHNIASDIRWSYRDGLFEYYCFTELGSYTTGLNKITSTECSMQCWTAALNEFVTTGEAGGLACQNSIQLEHGIYRNDHSSRYLGRRAPYVLTINGKFMGKYPPETNWNISP